MQQTVKDKTKKPTSRINSSNRRNPISLKTQYTNFEKTITCTNGELTAYAHLPHFNGNKSKPIHKWFTYKEGFSSELLTWVCQMVGVELDNLEALLDPYVGVATSLLSAQLNYRGNSDLQLVGVERNPFVSFVARTKLNWHIYDTAQISRLIPILTKTVKVRSGVKFDLLDLCTIQDQRIFNRRKLQDLLFARSVINKIVGDLPERDFFLLGWSSIIETVSNVRKDGRALRIVEKENRAPVYQLLKDRWESMLGDLFKVTKDLKDVRRGKVFVNIYDGDGRTLDILNQQDKKFDLILYSPPYLNNIDYSEVYKMELWLSGCVSTQEEFKNLRLSTFRSHPSIKFPETNHIDALPSSSWVKKLLNALLANIEKDKNYVWRSRLMRSYTDDMLISLRSQYEFAKPGAHVVCVVGNSLHGSNDKAVPVATDLLITALAQEVGFEIKRVQVTRYLRRRDHSEPYLRESVIILQRPLV
jgi:hypothetical protein